MGSASVRAPPSDLTISPGSARCPGWGTAASCQSPQRPSRDSLVLVEFTEGSGSEGGMRRFGLILGASALLIIVLLVVWIYSRPERGTTGSVSTRFHLLGPNDKIVVDGFDDPKVEGVACHIGRAQTGGLKGGFGVAEDTSDASIACRQIGPIKITSELKDGGARLRRAAQSPVQNPAGRPLFRSRAQRTGIRRLQQSRDRRQPKEQHQQRSGHELARCAKLGDFATAVSATLAPRRGLSSPPTGFIVDRGVDRLMRPY
jgi:CreA protein